MTPRIVHRQVDELAAAPQGFRRFETLCTVVYAPLALTLLWQIRGSLAEWPLLIPFALLLGMLGADIISGVAHWGFDTWGTPDTPLVGRTLIRTFREHHVDQKAITRHGFIETNGANVWGGCSVAILGLYLGDGGRTQALIRASLLFLSFFVAATSQIHKWAHMDSPPVVVRWLQRTRVLLSPDHHATHHAAPYDRSYCITCGWLNATLSYVHFFQLAEALITAVSGAVPRRDDIGDEAALALARKAAEERARLSARHAE